MDLRKLRGKALIERVGASRHCPPKAPAIRIIAALLILRETVRKPVLAGGGKPKTGATAETGHPLDIHYEMLQRELRRILETGDVAA